MTEFVLGATAMGCLVAAVFFLRFWRETNDRFFGLFALAFGAFACNRIVLAAVDESDENRPLVYLIRLAVFAVILFAIIDKNRRPA